MKQYVIDELRSQDHSKFKTYLDNNSLKSPINGLYWIKLDHNVLTKTQKQHTKCAPFYFTVNIKKTAIHCELLIRSKNTIKCKCIEYAEVPQILWIIHLIDELLDQLDIIT